MGILLVMKKTMYVKPMSHSWYLVETLLVAFFSL